MAYVLTVGLQTVRAEFNAVFPKRDKASDGWIGDTRHQTSVSGHNPDKTGRAEYKDGDALDEVRAIDVDKDLRDASGRKVTMEQVVQYLVKRARAGTYVPFRYLIFNGRIWSRSDGWKTRTYTGANKHDQHLHLSGDYTQTADGWKGSLGLKTLVTVVVVRPPTKPTPKPTGLKDYANGSRENSRTKNNEGQDVLALQAFIGERAGKADGKFGPATEKGVRWYQDMRGLKVDGVAGPKTWAPIVKIIGK